MVFNKTISNNSKFLFLYYYFQQKMVHLNWSFFYDYIRNVVIFLRYFVQYASFLDFL